MLMRYILSRIYFLEADRRERGTRDPRSLYREYSVSRTSQVLCTTIGRTMSFSVALNGSSLKFSWVSRHARTPRFQLMPGIHAGTY